jgi:cell division protein FtsW
MLLFVPWRFQRLVTFTNPWADPQNTGFQVVQSLIAIGSGGTAGVGFAQGKQKMFFLPFAHSDFIFAVVGEELGLFGALMVVTVFGILLWRGMRVALRAPDRFGMLLGLGLVVGIVVQALFNISVVLSLLPTKGIPLPFISYGGSSLVPTLAAMGILLNISQHSASDAAAREPKPDAETRGRVDAAADKRGSTASPPLSPRHPVAVSTRLR